MTSTCSLAAAAWKAFAPWLQKTTRRWGGVVSYDVTYKRAPSRSHGMLPAAHGSDLHSSLPDSAPTLQHPVRLQPFMRTLAAVSGSCCGRVRLRSQTPHGTAAAAAAALAFRPTCLRLASSAAKTSAQGAPSPQRQFEGSAPPLFVRRSRGVAPRCA